MRAKQTIAMKLVTVPTTLERRRRAGAYYPAALDEVLKLKPTTIETGLSPHYEWPCKDEQELARVASGVYAAKKRNRTKYEKVAVSVQRDPDRKRFVVYLWHQE